MAYSVKFTSQAVEDLARLDKTIAQNIANKIDWLSKNIESTMPAPLLNIHIKLLRYMPSGIAVKSIKYDTQFYCLFIV
jgi:mRNA-degrading endonuclease RelE of RelBE toxin-antitoxin system